MEQDDDKEDILQRLIQSRHQTKFTEVGWRVGVGPPSRNIDIPTFVESATAAYKRLLNAAEDTETVSPDPRIAQEITGIKSALEKDLMIAKLPSMYSTKVSDEEIQPPKPRRVPPKKRKRGGIANKDLHHPNTTASQVVNPSETHIDKDHIPAHSPKSHGDIIAPGAEEIAHEEALQLRAKLWNSPIETFKLPKSELFLVNKAAEFNAVLPPKFAKSNSSDIPHDALIGLGIYNQSHPIGLLQYLDIPASLCLTGLRDHIQCPSDYYHSGTVESALSTGINNSSSYFFIEGTFYIDERPENYQDYSLEPREWSQGRAIGDVSAEDSPEDGSNGRPPLFGRKSMADVKLCDLSLRLDSPYLFNHRGSCEHAIVIDTIRIFTKDDPPDITQYPMTHFQQAVPRRKCIFCTNRFAE